MLNSNEIRLLLSELDLEGSFIQKVTEHDYHSFTLSMFSKREKAFLLYFETGTRNQHFCRTGIMRRKSAKAQRFTQYLRANIVGSRIMSVDQVEGERTFLGYNLLLKDFHAEYYENGAPRNYLAVVSLSEPGSDTAEEFTLRVNHPYSHTFGQDIYLTSYDTTSARPRYCILQIVIQPWKYIQLLGIIMTLAGGIMLFAFGPRSGKKQLTQTT